MGIAITKKSFLSVTQSDLETLNRRECLNDTIIQAILVIFVTDPTRELGDVRVCPNSFMFNNIMQDFDLHKAGMCGEDQLKEFLSRGFRKLPLPTKWLLIPVHCPEQHHWLLAAVDFRGEVPILKIFDSLQSPGRNELCHHKMIRSSIEWWLLSVQYPLVWTHAVVPAVMGEPVLMDSPQQRNIFDCGMLLVFAVKAILDAPDSDFCGMGPNGTDDTPVAPPDWQS